MSLIKVTVSELESAQGQLSKLSNKVESCGNTVTRVKNNLDMKVKQKSDIDGLLDKSSRQLRQQADKLQSYVKVLSVVIDDFIKADRTDNNMDLPLISAIERITKIPGMYTPDFSKNHFLDKIEDITSE